MWSIQENAGYLLGLEPLWLLRVEELLAGRAELTPADLENRRTHEANHDAAALPDLLRSFLRARGVLTCRLDAVDEEALAHTALRPRLRVLMSLVDHTKVCGS